ncbi:MAG: peptidoglycan-binding domain-containing protein [Fidelibacterota bacterium]
MKSKSVKGEKLKHLNQMVGLIIFLPILMAQDSINQGERLNQIIDEYPYERNPAVSVIPLEHWYDQYNEEENILLKEILSHFGYEINTDTSYWSSDDTDIVKQFQEKNFIRVDGKIGPETLSTMSFILHELFDHESIESIQGFTQPTFGNILFTNYDQVKVGDIVKYWHPDFDKWLYARVTSIVGTTVTLNDWSRRETFMMDKDDIEGY